MKESQLQISCQYRMEKRKFNWFT